MSEPRNPDVQALAGEIKTLREDFLRIGKTLEELVRHKGASAAAEATQSAGRAWDEVGRTAQSATKTMEENPVATLAGAFGLGLMLGMLFGRR
ncbi:MAG: hypothetical protein KGL26_11515 [Pseudomonadota bacterium]|nr:hypothetical protein [Pseudomonadota bacterium]